MDPSHPVFVVGAPRTGTTLVKEILNRHPRIHLLEEVHFFERIWDEREHLGDLASPMSQAVVIRRVQDIVLRFGQDREVVETLTATEYRRRLVASGRKYRNVFRILLEEGARRRGAEIWGDSSPQNILYLDKILEWYPDARIVALVRDPRAFLASYKSHHRNGANRGRERYSPIPASMLWRSYMTALFETETKPWSSSVYRLCYEELADDPETTLRPLCEHVGVSFDPIMLAGDRADLTATEDGDGSESEEGVTTSSRARWRAELSPTELWLGERIFRKPRTRLGYPPPHRSDDPRLRPSVGELAGIAASLPGRTYNLLFHSEKPFTLSKLRRVLAHFRAR